MLARVAANIYWLARYLERVENSARMVNVHGHASLDLPKDIDIGWELLININGADECFQRSGLAPTEQNVVHFLLAERDNPGSLLSSLAAARENLRTTRDWIPREAWEQLNDLFLWAQQHIGGHLRGGSRDSRLRTLIRGIQQLNGLLAGAMLRDSAYDFLMLGMALERADMITRIIDVRAASIDYLQQEQGALQSQTQTQGGQTQLQTQSITPAPVANIQWLSVLKSLTAYQMYRQHTGMVRVRGAQVLSFLLKNERFPRSLYFCMQQLEASLHDLPNNAEALTSLSILHRHVRDADVEQLAHQGLHEFLDELQVSLGWIHTHINNTYFTGKLR